MNSDDNNNSVVVEYFPKKGDFSDTTWPRGVDFTPYFKNRSKMKRVQDHNYSGGGGDMSDLEQRVGKLEDKFQQILADTTQIKTTLPFLATREELLKESNIIQNQILKTKEDLQSQIYSLDKKISGLNWQFVLLYIIGALSVLSPHAVAILSHFIK
jgi:hypothetical protein